MLSRFTSIPTHVDTWVTSSPAVWLDTEFPYSFHQSTTHWPTSKQIQPYTCLHTHKNTSGLHSSAGAIIHSFPADTLAQNRDLLCQLWENRGHSLSELLACEEWLWEDCSTDEPRVLNLHEWPCLFWYAVLYCLLMLLK